MSHFYFIAVPLHVMSRFLVYSQIVDSSGQAVPAMHSPSPAMAGLGHLALVQHLYVCHVQLTRTHNFVSGEMMTLKNEFSFSVGKII